jgi:glycosyltransferase involved in cell wall biosynthesis
MEYPLMQQGGTEVLVRELLRGLSRHFELVLVTADESMTALPSDYAQLLVAHHSWNPRQATGSTARALAQALKNDDLALAHFHFGGTYEWASNRIWRCPVFHLAAQGVPCLSTNHLVVQWLNCGVHPRRSFPYKILAQAFAWMSRAQLYHRLESEVCVSKHDQLRLTGMFPIFRRKILQRYHSLLAADTPAPALQNRKPLVLCVGTVGGRKAQPLLVEAFARVADRHPQWHLDLVGRVDVPEDAKKIQDCVAAHKLTGRVHLSGWLTDAETRSRMQTASIFAIPSLQEGLGLSLQEALFNGCVAIGSQAGGIPELIDHEANGLLVPPGDVTALAQALDRLMSDATLLERLRTQARPSVIHKGMTADAMLDNYLTLYQRVLSVAER